MIHFGIEVAEGTSIGNLTAATGTEFPSNPNAGELFYRSDLGGLYVYSDSWTSLIETSEIGVSVQGFDADTAKLDVAQTWAATQTFGKAVQETSVALAANNIDLSLGSMFTKTISGATTFTVSNTPGSGTVSSFTLDLTNGGSQVVSWWAGVKWSGGTAPVLTSAGRDVLGFFTLDGGSMWTGLLLAKDVK